MALKGKCINSYPKNGRKVFVFKVTGTEEELEQYLEIQKKRFPEGKWTDDDGAPLYWTSSPSGAQINLNITTNGNIVEDTTELDLKASGSARYDHTYNTVMKGLNRAAGLQGVTQGEPTPSGAKID